MSEATVLIDSSVWVPFFHPHPAEAAREVVGQLLAQNRAAIVWLISVELLTGAKDDARYEALASDLAALRHLALSDEVFQYAAALRYRLGRQGLAIPVVDTVIASSAIIHRCELLHADRHFDLIAKHAPLKIWVFSKVSG